MNRKPPKKSLLAISESLLTTFIPFPTISMPLPTIGIEVKGNFETRKTIRNLQFNDYEP
jgi:hypothetical protein